MGATTSRKVPIRTDFPYWSYNQITIHLSTPSLNRLILIGVNEATWHEWDTRFDIWILDTAEASKHYLEIPQILKSPPNHTINFQRNKETAQIPTCAQGVDRWRKVAELLSMPLTMPAPWEDGVKGSQVGKGIMYRNFFEKRRKVKACGALVDGEMKVWYRFQRNQKVDNFVKAACREMVG